MNAYKIPRIAELAHQLRLSPARLRLQQVLATDRLLTLIDCDQQYPYSWVCWHITGYRAPIGEVDPASLRGAALLHDLLLLCTDITRRNPLPQGALPWPVWTPQDLAERLNVSTKTISRWRDAGLPTWHTVGADGVSRLTVPESGLRRFTVAHLDVVMRSRRFSQLTDKQRGQVLERARHLRASGCTSVSRICSMIATELGRSVETIRYTLLRHDPSFATNRSEPVEVSSDEHAVIFQCWQGGDTFEALAQRFGRTERTVRKICLSEQRRRLLARKIEFVYSPEFDLPDAESRIFQDDEPFEAPAVKPAGPTTEPRCLVTVGSENPLSANEEVAAFRRYNYCKFRLSGLQQRLRKGPSADLVEQACAWGQRREAMRARLVETNMRLVIAVARRHQRYVPNLEEMVSEGNMVLLRAIEKFDYTRGFKFSTYAVWGLMRHFARLMPLWQQNQLRQQTGCDAILEQASTPENATTALDQEMVGGLVHQLMDNLSRRERKIIQWHYGMGDGAEPRSLTEIAQRLGLSKERIRQIEAKGLAKLKAMLDERQFQYL
jgi:RNA polymerase sigma factor (sigma-70 family)